MTFSTYLDVAISLVFVFFTISMFVSGIVELINAFWEQRSRLLQLALQKILDVPGTTTIFERFWQHPLVRVKKQRYFGADKPISYLNAESFSTVILDLLTPGITPAPTGVAASAHMLATIRAVAAKPGDHPALITLIDLVTPLLNRSNTLAQFKKNLECWYDGYMEQVSGWYKRYAQGVVWIVATIVTIVMNVDTIHVTQRLFNDKDLRENLVAQADRMVQQQTKAPNSTTAKGGKLLKDDPAFLAQLQAEPILQNALRAGNTLSGLDSLKVKAAYLSYLQTNIDALHLPVGWKLPENTTGYQWVKRVLGWLLTIAALSFGAPFWFDLLIKLVNIRNTTRRPQSSVVPDSK